MPKVTVTLPIMVTLDIPEEFASKVSRSDIIEIAKSVIPDSSTTPNPLPNGVQITLDGCGQEEEDGKPVFADVDHIEHDMGDDMEIEFDDEGFTKADPSEAT